MLTAIKFQTPPSFFPGCWAVNCSWLRCCNWCACSWTRRCQKAFGLQQRLLGWKLEAAMSGRGGQAACCEVWRLRWFASTGTRPCSSKRGRRWWPRPTSAERRRDRFFRPGERLCWKGLNRTRKLSLNHLQRALMGFLGYLPCSAYLSCRRS